MPTFWVNDEQVTVPDDGRSTVLLDFVREELKLTGTKRGCDEGVCRACTVLIDGVAKSSCHVHVADLEGKRITTIEGLAKDGVLDPVQAAFMECSAVQCGFCTPGMIMAAKAFLAKNPDPTEDAIRKGLKFQLCRCGTYPRVVEAVRRAAALARGEDPGPFPREAADRPEGQIGRSVPRVDVKDKVTGRTTFIADLQYEDMLYGKIVWSQYPHAEILSIDTAGAEKVDGVQLVLTAKDIPGTNLHGVLSKDQPVLAEDRVRYIGEPVAVVFADNDAAARRGAEAVQVEYRELPGVFSIAAALAPDAPIIPSPRVGPFPNAYSGEKGNICKEVRLRRGDVEEAFREAEVVVDEEFVTPPEEHAWIETEGAVAVPGEAGTVKVYAPNQSPFADRAQLALVLGMAVEDVHVVHLPAGGAFGGKTELTTHAYVAIAALKTRRPAKMVLTRGESLRFHPKRHAYQMRYRIAARSDGTILGMDIRILADGGAYVSWSPRVLEQSVAFSTGPYHVPALNIEATCVYTNNLVAGAMRGFGANQVHFGVESAMDMLSARLGMSPLEVRRINGLRAGIPAATGQVFSHGVGYVQTVEAIQRVLEDELLPLKAGDGSIGVGVASAWRSVAGGLGPDEVAGASLQLLPTGAMLLKIACTEMGQGSHTSLAQMVAEILDLDVGDIEIVAGDTATVPYGGGVMASRGTYLWGHPTVEASRRMRALLLEKAAAALEVEADGLRLSGGTVVVADGSGRRIGLADIARSGPEPLEVAVDFVMPKSYPMLEDANESHTVEPSAYNVHHTVAYSTTAVAVQVDPTGGVKVLRCIAAIDGGAIINPESARTQVEGGIIMGTGFGLTNEFVIENGVPLTDTLGKCRLPRIDTVPRDIRVMFVTEEDPTGPFGSKGVAEIGVLGVAPALANAVYDAIGVRVTRLPITKYLKGAEIG